MEDILEIQNIGKKYQQKNGEIMASQECDERKHLEASPTVISDLVNTKRSSRLKK